MSLRKWNDNGVGNRGAKGIDGTKGKEFVHKYRDTRAEEMAFGRSWQFDGGTAKEADDSEYSGKTDTKAWSESPDYDTK